MRIGAVGRVTPCAPRLPTEGSDKPLPSNRSQRPRKNSLYPECGTPWKPRLLVISGAARGAHGVTRPTARRPALTVAESSGGLA